MALKPFNSVGGFSVGETPSNVILANGDISTTKINSGSSSLTLTANGNATTFQANGQIDIPATLVAVGNITAPYFLGNVVGNISGNITVTGSNTEILFNNQGNVGTSSNFTFNSATNVLTVTGNTTVSNLNTSGKVVASTLESNVATGTAPFVVASTTKVANLNVDTVDGFDTSQTATANTIAVRNADGNITANYFIGNGSQLTGIGTAGAISNGTSNVSIPTASGNVNTSVGGVANVLVVTSTGANIAGTLNATGNSNVGNLGTAGLITATGNVSGGNLTTAGALSVTGNANVGNLGTAGLITATGNITGGNLIGPLAGGNSNITITSNANISMFVAGNATARFVATTTGVNVAGTLNATGNANVGNIGATNANVTAITATGNANVGNLGTGGLIVATGNITGGNLNTGGVLSVTGNANVGNIGAAAGVFTGVLSTTSTLSVTGNANVGNIGATNANVTAITATGNANVGNLGTAGLIVATGNITGGNLNTAGIVSATGNVSGGNLTTSGVLTVSGTGVSSIAGNLDMTSNNIINLATPVNANDAATKQYVDDVAQGLHTHDTCNAATTDTLAVLSGGTVTYNNGSSGVGANLTTTGSFTTIDGVTLTNGMRILVKNEANSAHNGIYDRTSATVLTRSTDFDTPTEMAGGDFTFVTAGTLYDNTGWVMTDPVTTVGTSPVPWVQFSGAGTYTAGTGLTLTGSQFSVNVAQPTITSVGNLTSLTVTGNASAGNISTAGVLSVTGNANVGNIGATNANVTAITATGNANVGNLGTGGLIVATGNITGGNLVTSGVLSVTGNGNLGNVGATRGVFTNIVGTLETAAQPNITSVGTLSSLTVSGNLSAGNLSGVLANGNSNVSIPAANGNVNISSAGNANIVVVTGSGANITGYANITGNLTAGNINGGNLVVASFLQGTLTTAAQPNITSVGTLTSLSVSGNANVGNLGTAGLIVATGNVTGGNLVTGGALSVTGNANVGNIGAATGVFTTAVIANGANARVIANGITASGAMSGNANASTLTGNLGLRALASTYTDNVAAAGTVANTAIHGIGTPTFAASNAIVATNAATFFIQGAPVASTNVTITNGYALYVGSGNSLFTATVTAGNLSTGGTLSVTGNANVGNIGATAGVFTGALSTTTTLSVTGNANVGNLGTAGLITATGNITGGNLIGNHANGTSNVNIPTASGNVNISVNGTANVLVTTSTGVNVAGTLNATGNANVGNIGATNANLTALTATGNANVGNLGTGGLITATGNITGGNLVTSGQANITGNVIAGNVYANTGSVGANIAVIGNRIDLGNTDIGWATLTTTAVTANQTIATFAVSGVVGVEYLVRGVDSTGAKFSVATISAVTDGSQVDYATYATAGLGTTTGTLAVNISSGNIVLQVTPASTNSTVWTTQYRVV